MMRGKIIMKMENYIRAIAGSFVLITVFWDGWFRPIGICLRLLWG